MEGAGLTDTGGSLRTEEGRWEPLTRMEEESESERYRGHQWEKTANLQTSDSDGKIEGFEDYPCLLILFSPKEININSYVHKC